MKESQALIWDETFPSLLLKGQGTTAFLHGQTTADVFAKKELDRIFMSCWLSTKGSLKAVLEIRLSEDMAKIVIICGEINSIRDGFESVIFPADKVKLEVIDPIRRRQEINNISSWKESDFTWIDDNNFSIDGITKYKKATKEELEGWKIRQGIPSFDKEINGETNPYELGLADTINLDKGCYLGQEAMAKFFRSKSLKYQLRYWEAYGENDNFQIGKNFFNTNKNEGYKKNVGVVTSSIRVDDNFFNGLALIKKTFLDHDLCFSENGDSITIKKPISFTNPF
ncbi:folate-binding protein YgfZ [Prochlorococcus marinus]|uniref:Folate-dependent protein for Fe/S cluster synthesis/repair in oxidative stress n=1 Tax=Prochlorococcus marinus str. PAC1 TaxID=59924 RepID=A0A0A2C428_PROMR|nr:folate-binding protein YgfZ [Prochlorococcus marinus]KGG20297.1 Folate-dependent protein for Fe/S cluster synthesis/repair in oxidative stress [Prochlorococcus marinus str. PAC1]